MPPNNNIVQPVNKDFDKTTLFKPEKLIVNYNGRHSILLNDTDNTYFYKRLMSASNSILKELLSSKPAYYSKSITDEQWEALSATKCIQLKYEKNIKTNVLTGLLEVNGSLIEDIKNISDIIISADSGKLYIADINNNAYYEFFNSTVSYDKLGALIAEVSEKPMLSGIFLSKLYPDIATIDLIMPTYIKAEQLPVYIEEKELDREEINDKNDNMLKFFDKSSTLSIVTDSEGAVTYNDREGATVRIDTNGTLEYVRYNLSTEKAPEVTSAEALSISANFVNMHLGFPDDSYITGIQSYSEGARYLITYNYRQDGVPVLLDGTRASSAIEVELVGREVRRYRRTVRNVIDKQPLTQGVKSPTSILDAVFRESDLSGERVTRMNNMKVVYLERRSQDKPTLIPAWIVDVTTTRQENSMELEENRQYIINAETGIIVGK